MLGKRHAKLLGQQRESILPPFPLANDEMSRREIYVLYSQPRALQQAQA
jgi:hypothetical protein